MKTKYRMGCKDVDECKDVEEHKRRWSKIERKKEEVRRRLTRDFCCLKKLVSINSLWCSTGLVSSNCKKDRTWRDIMWTSSRRPCLECLCFPLRPLLKACVCQSKTSIRLRDQMTTAPILTQPSRPSRNAECGTRPSIYPPARSGSTKTSQKTILIGNSSKTPTTPNGIRLGVRRARPQDGLCTKRK